VVVDLLAVVARSVTVAWPLALLTADADESVALEVLKLTVMPLSGLPPSVTVAVSVVVVAPSAGIDAGDAVSDTASARNVTVVVCVTPLYVAVTVAVTVEPLDTDVSVLDVWPDPFVVADAGDIEPEVVLKLIDFEPAALPPIVSVALIALVLTPSAGTELGLGESDSETVRSVSVVLAVRPL